MLLHALKIIWFALSLSGLISCWAVLSAFAVAIRSYRLAILYCIGCTILHGMFCLGLIWRMDPFLMPRSFCIAQTLLFALSSYLLTGVCATFSMITSLAILRPGVWDINVIRSTTWPTSYTFTLIIFPALAWIPQITAVLKLEAAQPAEGFSCDANKPEWQVVRFLGYAGTPLVFSLPFSCLALMAVARMSRTQQRLVQRSRINLDPDFDIDSTNLTSLPLKRTRHKDIANMLGSPRISPPPIPTPRALPSPSPSSCLRSSIPPTVLTFTLGGDDPDTAHSFITVDSQGDDDSFASSAFPTFAPPSTSITPPNPRESPGHDIFIFLDGSRPNHRHDESHSPQAQITRYSPTTGWTWNDNRHNDNADQCFSSAGEESINWSQDQLRNENHHSSNTDAETEPESHGKGGYEFGQKGGLGEGGEEDLDIVEEPRRSWEGGHSSFQFITRSLRKNSPAIPSPFSNRKRIFSTFPLTRTPSKGLHSSETPGNIRPAIWRIIIFQLAFTVILILACISTLIDVITKRSQPAPFGTQHIGLLLTVWGPVFIFGRQGLDYMVKFKRTSSEPYTLITPLTSLDELEKFLQTNIFALVTDTQRKFVLAVATMQDLQQFVSRRGF
ncbi:hypothetical protein D9757_003812 [Collybiopsis confluens]|uniref:Uncharacterized protein n=1 Tax=Collybiopsis confluens TaxID=2823264 RepID=A0A8H5MDM0_9AGAR|nr:hypothetical protein D9757_003812 [Collybiopsis confluens]